MRANNKFVSRALMALLSQGITGLVKKLGWMVLGRAKRSKAEYEERVRAFDHRVRELGISSDVQDFYWYHTIDLGNGLVTPGIYDFRNIINQFGFPLDMTGMTVLDIGSATGFFAFEFERRGASVTSVELPSISQWDMLFLEQNRVLEDMRKFHNARSDAELTWKHLYGPFDFCHGMLKSKVRRCLSSVYNLSQDVLGTNGFDMIFFGDILPHLISPIQALDSVAKFCKGCLYVTGSLFSFPLPLPVAVYRVSGADGRSWWRLSIGWLESILRDVGFERTEVVTRGTIAMAPSFKSIRRPVIRAWKTERHKV